MPLVARLVLGRELLALVVGRLVLRRVVDRRRDIVLGPPRVHGRILNRPRRAPERCLQRGVLRGGGRRIEGRRNDGVAGESNHGKAPLTSASWRWQTSPRSRQSCSPCRSR